MTTGWLDGWHTLNMRSMTSLWRGAREIKVNEQQVDWRKLHREWVTAS